jgi:hypothetical protein
VNLHRARFVFGPVGSGCPAFGQISADSGHALSAGCGERLPIKRGTLVAASRLMMTALIILLALASAGLITELVAARRAPFGYQDEGGFHFGNERRTTSKNFQLENPS